MVQFGQEVFLGLPVPLLQVQHEHTRHEVTPQKSIVGQILVGIEENDFLPVFASDFKGRHVDVSLRGLAEKSTDGFLLLADDEIDQKTLPDLPGSKEGDNVEIVVVLVGSEIVDEFIVEL